LVDFYIIGKLLKLGERSTVPDDDEDERPRRYRRRRRDPDEDEADEEDEDYEEDEDRPRRLRPGPPKFTEVSGPEYIIPGNTTFLAIAAGYLGLISVLCFPAPFALGIGIWALIQLRQKPKLHGRLRATFAVVMGAIFTIPLPYVVYAIINKN
jgi:hypothetical protein